MGSPTAWRDAAADAIAAHGRAGWAALLTACAAACGRLLPAAVWGLGEPASEPSPLPELPEPGAVGALDGSGAGDLGAALARLHLDLLTDRSERGAFYTPPDLADWLAARALAELPPGVRVLDPACGAGDLLLAALRRGVRGADLHGSDLDAVAVAIARWRLLAADPELDPDDVVAQVRVADGLGAHPGAPFDVVLGNPPFLGRLRAATATTATGGLGAYTDAAAVFLHRGLDLIAPGGRLAMVQPVSVLAARDAGAVRAAVLAAGHVRDLWVEPVDATRAGGPFPGLHVQTCAVVVERPGQPPSAPAPRVRVWTSYGRGARGRLQPAPRDATGWAALGARAGRGGHRVPAVRPRTRGTLGDLAVVTADFRDEYYGLVPHVRDLEGVDPADPADPAAPTPPGLAPLVTSGLIDPATCAWGRRPARFARRRWHAPVVPLAELPEPLATWARGRLVPKVLVAPQGRVVEAVADPAGRWLPSVPVISVVPREEDPRACARLLALLLAPTTSALLAARLHGSGMGPGAVRFSARHLADVPLPADHAAWESAVDLVLQDPGTGSGADASRLVEEVASRMGEAFGDTSAHAWWSARRPRNEEFTSEPPASGRGVG